MVSFNLNGKQVSVDAEIDTPLLWILRDHLNMNGTKFGCGAGLCGACTILLDDQAIRSCVIPLAAIEGKSITTIEGLGDDHPVQQAWTELSVAQCGYCQPGQIMSTVSLLNQNSAPSDDEIKSALAGNICRCGTYQRIIAAVHKAAENELFYEASSTTSETTTLAGAEQ
jgi:isoquinoline 1-oxidoreductase alpha subunit